MKTYPFEGDLQTFDPNYDPLEDDLATPDFNINFENQKNNDLPKGVL